MKTWAERDQSAEVARERQLRTCDFCDEFSDGRKNTFILRYAPAFLDRVILATEHFRVIPSLGQITQGHLLIVPLKHFCSLCDVPPEQWEALENLRVEIRSMLQKTYGACVFFEHGIRGERSGGCGIDHAHMHALPVAARGVVKILKQRFGGSVTDSIEDARRKLGSDDAYLFFEDVSGEPYVFPANNLPSQYMRKLVAESIGNSDWDWRLSGHEPELISTVQRLLPLFSQQVATRGGGCVEGIL